MNYKVVIAALLIAAVARADDKLEPLPPGWGFMGNGGPQALRGQCEFGIDGALAQAGQDNLSIRCNDEIPAFGGLTDTFMAADYFGKRVRFSGWLQAEGMTEIDGIESGGGLFITVPTARGPLMNGMEDRKLTGWTNWEYREFVVDIPAVSELRVNVDPAQVPMAIGFWMQGQGQIWIRDFKIEIVSDEVPVNLSRETDTAPGPVPIGLD